MKKHYPPVLRGKETGRVNREEAVSAILRVRAAKRAEAAAKRRGVAEARKAGSKAQQARHPGERP